MNSIKDTLISKLTDQDKERPRSVQTRIGPSEIGGCSTRVWHKINGTEETNPDTLRLAAIMGTAIHAMIEDVFADDPRYLVETEVEAENVMGHIDLIDTETKTIWDWKTTTKNSLRFFGSEQQKMQVHLYGYLANANGIPVEYVGLVGISRDGNENDIVEIIEKYDEEIALSALDKFHKIRNKTEAPKPEKEASFCVNYCQFFGACPGIVNPSVNEIIDNPEIANLATEYKVLQKKLKEYDAQLDYIKDRLRGTTGTTLDGSKIQWVSVAGRQTVDESAVLKELGYVPKKQSNGYDRLTIK